MNRFTLDTKPTGLRQYRKRTTAWAVFLREPFEVETQEGLVYIGPRRLVSGPTEPPRWEGVDDWDGGYWLVYPDDGSKPYTWSRSFMLKNMELVPEGPHYR